MALTKSRDLSKLFEICVLHFLICKVKIIIVPTAVMRTK